MVVSRGCSPEAPEIRCFNASNINILYFFSFLSENLVPLASCLLGDPRTYVIIILYNFPKCEEKFPPDHRFVRARICLYGQLGNILVM